jgi:branched-chain amino acid transport system permease protein
MQDWSVLVSIAFLGIAYGMVLYLISVGLSVTMGLMGFVNLAHGVFAMAGGYVTVTLINRYGVPFFVALAAAAAVGAALGLVLERTLYARLYGTSDFDQVLFSIGLIFVSMAVAQRVWGPLTQPMVVPPYLKGVITVAGHEFPTYRVFLIGFSIVIITSLWLTLEHSRFGALIRAAVDNRRMAQSLGVNTGRLFAQTFALGSGLAGLGGGLGADILVIAPGYPIQYILYFMIVVILGGLGTIRGPFLAALLLGLADTACRYFWPQIGAVFIFILVFIILYFRPQGLLRRGRA